jgi:hypothetical protein
MENCGFVKKKLDVKLNQKRLAGNMLNHSAAIQFWFAYKEFGRASSCDSQ